MGDEMIRRFVLKYGGKQIVSLGSGYDTRGYRLDCLTSKTNDVKYFEVDVQTTQQSKLKALQSHHISNSHVTYVPVDFSSETFTECLLRHGWDRNVKTLFLWEGVAMYLSQDAVYDTFRAVSKCPSGSYLFFDTLVSEKLLINIDYHS